MFLILFIILFWKQLHYFFEKKQVTNKFNSKQDYANATNEIEHGNLSIFGWSVESETHILSKAVDDAERRNMLGIVSFEVLWLNDTSDEASGRMEGGGLFSTLLFFCEFAKASVCLAGEFGLFGFLVRVLHRLLVGGNPASAGSGHADLEETTRTVIETVVSESVDAVLSALVSACEGCSLSPSGFMCQLCSSVGQSLGRSLFEKIVFSFFGKYEETYGWIVFFYNVSIICFELYQLF